MVDNRKEQERSELHRTIWNIANDHRGSVDGWDNIDINSYKLGGTAAKRNEKIVKLMNGVGEMKVGE